MMMSSFWLNHPTQSSFFLLTQYCTMGLLSASSLCLLVLLACSQLISGHSVTEKVTEAGTTRNWFSPDLGGEFNSADGKVRVRWDYLSASQIS